MGSLCHRPCTQILFTMKVEQDKFHIVIRHLNLNISRPAHRGSIYCEAYNFNWCLTLGTCSFSQLSVNEAQASPVKFSDGRVSYEKLLELSGALPSIISLVNNLISSLSNQTVN